MLLKAYKASLLQGNERQPHKPDFLGVCVCVCVISWNKTQSFQKPQ